MNRLREVINMEINDIVSLFINNGVAVAVIVYFMIRDIKFINNLMLAIQELKDSVQHMTKIIEKKEGDD